MKKVALLAHCILNPYCELPKAPDQLRKPILEILLEKGWGIVQLPCPELCYQALERNSITPEHPEAQAYRESCRELLKPTVQNMKEYEKHGIEIGGILGIRTSPSCSVSTDPSCRDRGNEAIMMEVLFEALEAMGWDTIPCADMPIVGGGQDFLEQIRQWR